MSSKCKSVISTCPKPLYFWTNLRVTGTPRIGKRHGRRKGTGLGGTIFLFVEPGTSHPFFLVLACRLTVYCRYSILPAISLDGFLHLDILTRSWTSEEFRKYVDVLLDNMNQYPQKNSVLVMDNASAHHFEGLREMVEARCVATNHSALFSHFLGTPGVCASFTYLRTPPTSIRLRKDSLQ